MHTFSFIFEDGIRLDVVGEKELLTVGLLSGACETHVLPQVAAEFLDRVVEKGGPPFVARVIANPVASAGGAGLHGRAAEYPNPVAVLVLGDQHGGKNRISPFRDAFDVRETPSEADDADVSGFEDGQSFRGIFLVVPVVYSIVSAAPARACREELV